MYKVFLSSTSRDLAAYREAVHRAIDGLPGFQLVKMEDFGTRDASARDLCVRLVGECDLLVGLMGHYYGSCPPNEERSFTEIEYRTASAAGLPRLMFVAPDDFPIPASLRESDASFARQQAFRREVMNDLVVGAFDSPEELASAVTRALFVWHEERRAATPASGMSEETDGTESPEPPLGPNPYRGLEAFRKEDADRFFGREALVDQLWHAFLALHRGPGGEAVRLLAILGASGSGKSSVAQAGLLAELDQRPLPGRPAPSSVVLTPEARPLESLAVALARLATGEAAPARKAQEFEQILRTREQFDGLRYLAAHMLGVERSGLILLIDQFEELYSLCDHQEEREAFIGNLLAAARAPDGDVSILLTLRSDFLGALNQHPEISQRIAAQHVVVPVMGEAELRRAIEEPALRAGRSIDPATVDLLLEQTRGREGALPLLEFVLTRIWQGFADGVPAAVTVHDLGGVGGALASQAQAVYDGLDAKDREIARRAFLTMVRLGEGTRDTRRRAPLSEMVTAERPEARVLAVLRRFSEPGCRLISLSGAAPATTAEVAHEALFDHWRLLQDWLDESREDLRFQRRLADAARHWQELGRPDGSLWRPPELDVLREFRARAGADMTPLEAGFADASDHQETRRRWRRRAGIAAAIGGLLILAGGLTIYSRQQAEFAERQAVLRQEADQAKEEAVRQAIIAKRQQDRADQQRDQAISTQSLFLAQLSEQESARGNATRGILLALEALPADMAEPDRPYVIEAEAALYQAVLAHRELAVLRGHEAPIQAATFSPDGSKLVTTARDGTVRLWDAASGKELAVLDGDGAMLAAAFSQDGAGVVTLSDDGTARLWKATGNMLGSVEGDWGAPDAAAFSADGARVETVSDRTAQLWHASGKALAALELPEPPTSARFTADGARAVTVAPTGAAQLWDVAAARLITELAGHGGEINMAAFSPDGTRIVTAADDGTARLWDGRTGAPLLTLQGHGDRVLAGAFSPDGARVLTTSSDRSARLWDARTGAALTVLAGHGDSVWSAAFSPDGARVVTASDDGTARIWNLGGSPLVQELKGHDNSLRAATFDPTGRLILTAGHDLTVRLWDAADGREVKVLRGHTDAIRSAAFDRDGKRVLSATSTGVAQLWEVATGAAAGRIEGHEDSVRSADFSPDGRSVLTASYDRTARIWDIATGDEVARLDGYEQRLTWAAFSPDGKRAVTAEEDGMVRVWDLASLEAIELSGHRGTVRMAQYSPDGRRVLTASTDHTARLWDAASGKELAVLRGHDRPVLAASFNPDGSRVVTAAADDTARVWRVFRTTQELIDYAKGIVPDGADG